MLNNIINILLVAYKLNANDIMPCVAKNIHIKEMPTTGHTRRKLNKTTVDWRKIEFVRFSGVLVVSLHLHVIPERFASGFRELRPE